MTGIVSVRLSQILAGVVLAFMAAILYRTSIDTLAVRSADDLRSLGSQVTQRESARIDQTAGAIMTLKDHVGYDPFHAARFVAAARALMQSDRLIVAVDFFDTNDEHVAHVEATGHERLGRPSSSTSAANVSGAVVAAVEFVLTEAEVTRTMVSSHAVRDRKTGKLSVFVAMPIIEHLSVVGTVVAQVDAQKLLVNDLVVALTPARFVIDDGSGRLKAGTVGGVPKTDVRAQTFSIPFADREWKLTVAPSTGDRPPSAALFVLLWLIAWLAVGVPIEVVGQISRRVHKLNQGLEASVAEGTKELRSSVAELQTLAAVVESVHEGVMLVDADDVVRYANHALCRELGCEPRDLIGKHAYDFTPLALSRAQLKELAEAVRRRGFAYLEIERTRTDGSKYWAGITLTSRSDDRAESAGLIAVSRDVSDRRRLVDEMMRAKEELERQMRVRADFIGTASHELRTPATTLRTLSALLRGKVLPRYQFSDEDAKLLGMLDFETRRLANLVDDLLEVARVDAGERPLADRDVDLGEIVRTEIEGTFALDRRAGPPILLQLPPRPVFVRADENALRRIVVNLVGNARKFTPDGGSVAVTVERTPDRARLVVADTGIGIPKKDLPHVFERFYRVERPGTAISGTGLGLAIVARLVERMRGVVSLSSEVGKGTTVSVEMPAAEARAAASK
jgi:PAS domain S-box-containing protein